MKTDLFWGYLSQFLQYGAALLVLPLLLTKLNSAELGVWFVFMTIAALVSMLDMGFSSTLARNVSYLMGGAKKLQKYGYEVVEQTGDIDYGLLKAMIAASRHIFFLIAAFALFLLAVPGSAYIIHVASEDIDQHALLQAWGVFVLATVINIFFTYYTPLLQGRSLYAGYYKSSAIANISFIAISALFLFVGFGLLAVAFGYLGSALVGSWLKRKFLFDVSFKEKLKLASTACMSTSDIFELMWHNAWRMGVVLIGSFLILRANTLLSAAYLGLVTTAAYAMTLQVFSVLQSLSIVVFNIQLPKLAQFRINNQRKELMHTIEFSMGWALLLFSVGSVMILFFGAPMIRWIGGQTEILPVPFLAWIGLMMFLELNHSLAAGVIVTANKVPFMVAALLSGAGIFILSWIGLKYGGFGVGWLIGSQFVVQLAYNNWQWPWRIYCEFYRPKVQV